MLTTFFKLIIDKLQLGTMLHLLQQSASRTLIGFPSFLEHESECKSSNRVFYKLAEIGNNANIGIRGFTT